MKLLAVVLLLLPLSGCLAEVVNDFTVSCKDFFATPNGVVSSPTKFIDNNNQNRYKQICQTLNNKIEFATFYDTENRIPVYSAYRFEKLMGCNRKSGDWYIEPQLDQGQAIHMETESKVKKSGINLGLKQALNADYDAEKVNNFFRIKKNNKIQIININKYERGHLAPVSHANTQSCANATFTLTNAAPQWPSFNKLWFHHAEKPVAESLSTICPYTGSNGLRAYVVTGVVPGNTNMNNRVRVPSHYWTAFCCLNQNNQAVQSGGYIGKNIENAINPQKKTRLDLEKELTKLYKTGFTLFGGGC